MRFPTPSNLNGDMLKKELADQGIPATVSAYGNEIEVLADAPESAVRSVVQAHVGGPTQEQRNRTEIEAKAREALATNKSFIASTPNNAAVVAQVKALSRQQNGIIRLLLTELGGTE